MVEKGSAYSTTIKGVGRVESGWVSQTLYEGWRKWVILFFLIILIMVCGPPFGALGMVYDMPPLWEVDPLSKQGLQNNIYNWDKDKASLTTWAWVGFITFIVLLLAYVIGWIVVARRYAFARTTLTKAADKKKQSKKKSKK